MAYTYTNRRQPVVVDGRLLCIGCDVWVLVEGFYAGARPGTYQPRCKTCMRYGVLLSRMGVTREWYEAKLEEQGGVCAICKQLETVRRRGEDICMLSVDHDHRCCPGRKACGKCARGLICHQCNIAVGIIEKRGVTGAAFDEYLASA